MSEASPGTEPPRASADARAAAGAVATDRGAFGRFFTFSGLDGALLRYRVMAWVVGVGLFTLVFVGIPLQIAGHAELVAVAGPIHGFFYIVYLIMALDLARRARFRFLEMVAMVGAGFLPILAFVIERWITRRVRTEVLPTWSLPGRR